MKRKKMTKKTTRKEKSQNRDIIVVLKEEHMPLKKLIRVLKSDTKEIDDRKKTFEEFVSLIIPHAKAEEKVLYKFLKEHADMKEEGFEGDVEHGLAEQMIEEAKRTDNEDLWSARVKVLAELVEHHIKEEEGDIFPEFKKNSETEDRTKLAVRHLEEKRKVDKSEQAVRRADFKETPIHIQ